MYGRFGSREHGGQGFGLAQRLLAHPDNLPGSFPAPWSEHEGEGQGGPPAPAPGGTPAPQVNPLHQQMNDFFSSVYNQPGDATVADYLGSIQNGAYVPPTGMPQGFTDRVNGFFSGHPNALQHISDRFGSFGSTPIPDARLSQFASSGHWPMGMGLWYGFRGGMGQGGQQGDPQSGHGNYFRRRRHGSGQRNGEDD